MKISIIAVQKGGTDPKERAKLLAELDGMIARLKCLGMTHSKT
jgi:hypothetical protein